MRIHAGQHLRLEQRMKLSPRMIQSMEILQLSAMALEERIDTELEKNPVLDLTEATLDHEVKTGKTDGEREMVVGDNDNASQDFQRADDLNEQYGEDWAQNTTESAEFHTPTRRAESGERDSKMDAMANTASRGPALTDQLEDQWRFIETDEATRKAGEHLLEFIDEDGYLRTDMEQIAHQAPPGITREDLDHALMEIKLRLEPTGIGARDLIECMTLQLDAIIEEEGADDDLDHARLLITRYRKDLEMNRLPRIVKASGLTIEQIKSALDKLKRLDPRPGRRLAPERTEIILPDIIVEYDPVHDAYVAGLNRGRQPALRINPQYRQMAKDREQDRSTRKYIADNMSNARWLIDAIQQRNSTLLRVVNVVIDAQREFLDHGEQHLKPLPMIQVADQLGIHVGTVSRAVADKYMQTPRGIFPLRMFFSGGTESSSGEEMSWSAVQAKLKEIIDNEDPKAPFSDDALVDEMKKAGLEIARRTVAKYRGQMNIPPARRRKQF
ncbi:RNA polymerase factor sigma-54 [Planctomycetales bacterium ZRK34]|nr:RNA polymerase factor sigma-54 [Planctomycetales bacterium ZRK34]